MDKDEKYAVQKKVLRLLLDFDKFAHINFDKLLSSEYIDQKEISIADNTLIKNIITANNTHQATQNLGVLKRSWEAVKYKDYTTQDFETVTKRDAEFALYMRLKPLKLGFDLKGFETTPEGKKRLDAEYRRINQLIYITRDSEEWGKIQPSEGQRCFVYIKINVTDKEAVIDRLKKAFPLLNITKVYGNPFLQKEHVYKNLIQKYNELKAEENKA